MASKQSVSWFPKATSCPFPIVGLPSFHMDTAFLKCFLIPEFMVRIIHQRNNIFMDGCIFEHENHKVVC